MAPPNVHSFRVLGDVSVVAAGHPVELGGKKVRALLALLVLDANRLIPTDRLVHDLWGDEPPRTARKTVQVHVSRLRKVLGDDVVESRPNGYLLCAAPEQVDLLTFDGLVERGREALRNERPDEASAALREALALWRGPALAGIENEPFAATAATRLEDARLAAVELRIEADLALNRQTSLVGELERLVADHPFHEGFRRQLMLALYRSGRQADALGVYRETRRTFADELGIEPGPELRDLETAILRQDASLAAPTLPRARRRRARVAFAAGVAVAALAATGAAVAWGNFTGSSGRSPLRITADSVVRIDPDSNTIVQATKVGRDPDQLAARADAVWVVNFRDRTVTRVRTSGAVETVGGVPYADHIAVDGPNLWVSSFDRGSVARIDARSGEVVSSVGLPTRHAEGLAVGGGYLWITNPANVRGAGTETVSGLDLRSGEIVSRIAVGATPIFTTFGYGAVWVANYDDGTVSVIAPGSAKASTIRVGNGPLGIATGAGSVWVVNYWSRQLTRIDPRTRRVVARIKTGLGPLGVGVGGGAVWVTNRDSRSVMRFDAQTNRLVKTIRFPAPLSPFGVVVGKDGVWVSVRRCGAAPCL